MGLISFLKDAGEKLFGGGAANAAPAPAAAAPSQADVQALSQKAAEAIRGYINAKGLPGSGLDITFDPNSTTVTVSGQVPDQATKEKIILSAGNVNGVSAVNDMITVADGGAESTMYTVKSGDTLSKISKEHYGDANQYMKIFEANKPMLSHPDKIYPGQVLRIPAE